MLGRLAYLGWYKPVNGLRHSIRHGGPVNQWRTRKGEQAMEISAWSLPPLTAPVDHGLVPVHFLTGRRFWYQTAFCISTLARNVSSLPRVVFHDDGTLNASQCEALTGLVPGSEVLRADEAESRVHQYLPADRFPILNAQWRDYVNLRKLISPHLVGDRWKLVLDSDMLFFQRPDEMLDWQRSPGTILLMRDVTTSYGYPLRTLDEMANGAVPRRLNVGICGIRSGLIDWQEVESWAASLITKSGTSYYLEQALVALLAARHGCQVLDDNHYQLQHLPGKTPAAGRRLTHFVDRAKADYFQRAWRAFT